MAAQVTNYGRSPAGATTLRWYLSTDSTISSADTLVGSNALSSLAAGVSMMLSNTITTPSATNTYYYGACVDPVMGEHYTNDNCSSALRVDVVGN